VQWNWSQKVISSRLRPLLKDDLSQAYQQLDLLIWPSMAIWVVSLLILKQAEI
jgi:hypothetical protein